MKKLFKGKRKVIFVIAAILIVCIIAGALLGKKGADTGFACTTSTIERADLRQTISIKGTVQGSDSADVYSASNYRITSVNVKVGDVVSEGQVLATLDADDLSDEYNKALVAYNEAKRAYEAQKLLYSEGAVSENDYLTAKANYDTCRLTLSSFNMTENSTVTSPIAGTVTRVNATAGKLANSGASTGEPLFVVENLDRLQMKVKISEYDISNIKVGQSVVISAEVLGKETVSGVVSQISPTGEQRDQSSTEMVIPVVIDIDKGDTNLIAGVTAKAEILTAEASDVLTVPIDAILEDPETGDTYIFTVGSDSTLSKVKVNTGLESDLYIEISGDGLKEGTLVMLAPTHDCYDGMKVNVPASALNEAGTESGAESGESEASDIDASGSDSQDAGSQEE